MKIWDKLEVSPIKDKMRKNCLFMELHTSLEVSPIKDKKFIDATAERIVCLGSTGIIGREKDLRKHWYRLLEKIL